MFIITHISLMSEVTAMHPELSFTGFSVKEQEIVESMEQREDKCYCWYAEGVRIPEEVEKVFAHKDLCAEEYEFDDIYPWDTLVVWQEENGAITYTQYPIEED